MKKFTTIRDIEQEKQQEERQKFTKEIAEDIKDVMNNTFKKDKPKKRISFWKIILFLLFLLFIINFILGNIWLLKFLIKSLFMGE